MLESRRPTSSDPFLAERAISDYMPEGVAALIDDLFTVSDKQQTVPRQRLAKTRVVNRSHDGLTCSSRCHKQVVVMSLVTSQGDLIEQQLLKRPQHDFEWAQQQLLSRLNGSPLTKFVRVIRDEIAACPVALEDGVHLRHRIRITSLR